MQSRTKIIPAHSLVGVIYEDPVVRKKLVSLLGRSALDPEVFDSGEDLLAKLDKSSPDCLIVGLELSDQSGLELMKKMHKRGLKIPTIFLSEKGNVPTAVAAIRHGAADVIQLPWVERQLRNKVKKLLGR